MEYCIRCGREVTLSYAIGRGIIYCEKCTYEMEKEKEQQLLEEKGKTLKEIISNAPELKCPYCDKPFVIIPAEKYSLEDIYYRYIPCSLEVVTATRNQAFIECPYCETKIYSKLLKKEK